MFERISGAVQEQAARFNQRKLLEFIAKADPAHDDLQKEGVTAESLQNLITEAGSFLTEEEKTKIETLANHPEIKEHLPQMLLDEKLPVPESPSREQLSRVFSKELTAKELERAAELVIALIKDGTFQVFVGGHRWRKKVSPEELAVIEEIINEGDKGWFKSLTIGDQAKIFPKLLPGYRKAKRFLRRDCFDRLISLANCNVVNQCMISAQENSQDRRKNSEQEEKFFTTVRGHDNYFLTAIKDLYLPTTEGYKKAVRDATAKIRQTTKGLTLVQEVTSEIEAYKCIDIHAVINRSRSNPRAAQERITIITSTSRDAAKMLQTPTDSVDDFGYEDILRALKTNPGFMLEALRKAIGSELFYSHPDAQDPERDSFYPDTLSASKMVMHLEIPEFKSYGLPSEMPFQKINP